ncbi:MAG: DUF4381 domain-containing protein [Kistimonas sp.]|nr:DUF4381 domain-containing protein [Kistimonas sp.]
MAASSPPPDATQAQLLASLEPNLEPAAIGFWPPAPGWWLLACLTVCTCLLAGRSFWKQRHANRYRRQALQDVGSLYQQHLNCPAGQRDIMGLARSYNRVLKHAALQAWPRARVASLCGQDWLDFLVNTQKDTACLEGLSVLGQALYTAGSGRQPPVTPELLHAAVRHWIKTHNPSRPPPKQTEIPVQ